MAIIKTSQEIAYIKTACQITDKIFKKTLNYIIQHKECTEIEVRDFILNQIKEFKLKPSFVPIVTSGPRAGNEIHPRSTQNKIKGFVIIDLGVRVSGYCSDMTRTIYVGTPLNKDMEI